MRKAIPIAIVLLGLFGYVYFFRILPQRQVDPRVKGSGSVEVEEIVVTTRLAARLVSVEVEEGQKVEAGQVLAKLDCADLEARILQAQAQVDQAQAVLAQAEAARGQVKVQAGQARASLKPIEVNVDRTEREKERLEGLANIQGVPRQAADEAGSAADLTKAQLEAARINVAVASKSNKVADRTVAVAASQVTVALRAVETMQVQLEECTLKSPISAVVIRRNYSAGELLLPGASLLTLADLGNVYTVLYVPNAEVGRVRLGQAVTVEADTYPGRAFKGKVTHVNERAEFTPKSIQTKDDRTRLVFGVKVALENQDMALLPGMPVEAVLVEAAP